MHEALARKNFERDTQALTDVFCERNRWALDACAFPIIDVTFLGQKPLRVRLNCTDWDEQPPSAALLTASGEPWSEALPGGVFNGSKHEKTGLFFVCMRGIREFHEHSSHLTEHWASYRGQDGMNLIGLLRQLSAAWRKAYPA